MSDMTIVHLLRHGEVENPVASHMAACLAITCPRTAARWPRCGGLFRRACGGAIYCSPLERAQETARPVAERLGLEIVTETG